MQIGYQPNERTSAETELQNCTFVKTVLMLLVVIYHCLLYWNGSWFIGEPVYSAKPLALIAVWLNTFHIYAFTLVSGYLFYALKYEKGKYSRFLPFATNKCKRLLLPYAVVSLAWVIPFSVYFFQYDVADLFKYFVLGMAPSQLWFLLMLFFTFLLFFPLSSFYKKNFPLGLVVVLLFYGVGVVGAAVLPNVFQIFRACTYLSLFWLGFKIRQYGSQAIRKIPWWIWILFDLLVFSVSRYISRFDGVLFRILQMGLDFVLHVIGALMAFVVLQCFAEHVNWKNNRVFGMLCKNSMPVYLFHQQIVYITIVCFNGAINPYLHAGINFVGAMVLSLIISLLLMKFKWTRFLIGEK